MYPAEPADPTTDDTPTQSQKDNNIYDSNGTYIGVCRVICTKTGTNWGSELHITTNWWARLYILHTAYGDNNSYTDLNGTEHYDEVID